VLAEPVVLGLGPGVHPYQALRRPGFSSRSRLFFEFDGTLLPGPGAALEKYFYIQVTRPPRPGQEDVSVPQSLQDSNFARVSFRTRPIPRIRRWTLQLLDRLAAQRRYGLPQGGLKFLSDNWSLEPDQREAVARALCQYLATSPEFTYSLDLRRSDPRLDPTEDFLFNVKEGHCERYAGALALMLRAVGIPSRLVKGFRGADPLGEGRYVVRQSHAHAWVEALVPAKAVAPQLAWLTLDPTPEGAAEEQKVFSWARFWDTFLAQVGNFWRNFIVDFNPDHQREALVGLWNSLALPDRLGRAGAWVRDSYTGLFWAKPGFWILTASGTVLLVWLGRRLRSRRLRSAGREAAAPVGFYQHLLAILARRCQLRPQPAQTPREFAAAARCRLQQAPATAALAGLPAVVADRFNLVRYGGEQIPETECREIDLQLDRLDAALAGRGGR
jgi:hypothetical protein